MIAAVLFALLATVVLLLLLQPLLSRLNMVDVPNERSSHSRPILRGGGLAIALGTCAALLISDAIDDTYFARIDGLSDLNFSGIIFF